TNDLILLRNDGAGNFAAPITLMANAGPTYVIGDLNHDSRPDIVVATATGFSVLLANATGGYAAPINVTTAGPNVRVRALGDFNEDGNVDLVILEGNPANGSGHVTMLLGNGLGGFGSQTETGAGTRAFYTSAADMNNDGHLDLISAEPTLNSVSVQLGTGTG